MFWHYGIPLDHLSIEPDLTHSYGGVTVPFFRPNISGRRGLENEMRIAAAADAGRWHRRRHPVPNLLVSPVGVRPRPTQLTIRRHGQVVQNCPWVTVVSEDIPGLSPCDGSCLPGWQQYWQQSRRLGTRLRP